jgi:hypothetical protein
MANNVSFGSMGRIRRHEIDAPRSMAVPTRSAPGRERTVHAHAPGIPISAYGHSPMALAVRIQIFSTAARIPTRRIVRIPAALRLRRGVCLRRTRVRAPRRRARGRGRGLRAREGDVVPDAAAGTVHRAGAALGRGFRVAAAGGARPR